MHRHLRLRSPAFWRMTAKEGAWAKRRGVSFSKNAPSMRGRLNSPLSWRKCRLDEIGPQLGAADGRTRTLVARRPQGGFLAEGRRRRDADRAARPVARPHGQV